MKQAFLLAFLIGCDSGKEVTITTGDYTFSSLSGGDTELSVDLSLSIEYGEDDEANVITFTVSGEEFLTSSLTLSPEEEWLDGCPTNMSSTTLQTMRLDSAIDFGDLFEPAISLEAPMLAPSCSTEGPAGEEYPTELYLFEKDDAASGLGPCPGELCLVFN